MKFELPKEAIEKMRLVCQPPPNVSSIGKKLTEAADAQTKLPERIDNLTTEVGKLAVIANAQFEIAKVQAQLAEESGKHAAELTNQTQRLVCETFILRRFTKGVFWLTVALSAFTLVLIIITYLDYSTKAHDGIKDGINDKSAQNHQTGQ